MRTLDIFYLVAVWFFVLSLVSKENRITATFLFLFSIFNVIVFDLFSFTQSFTYIDKKEFLIKLDGSAALIMTMFMVKESKAYKQALILSFMVLCHTMILLHLITDSYFMWAISKPFYETYDELIIMAALLQIWVSYDGMVKGLSNTFRDVQGMLFRFVFYSNRIRKDSSTQKKRKANP